MELFNQVVEEIKGMEFVKKGGFSVLEGKLEKHPSITIYNEDLAEASAKYCFDTDNSCFYKEEVGMDNLNHGFDHQTLTQRIYFQSTAQFISQVQADNDDFNILFDMEISILKSLRQQGLGDVVVCFENNKTSEGTISLFIAHKEKRMEFTISRFKRSPFSDYEMEIYCVEPIENVDQLSEPQKRFVYHGYFDVLAKVIDEFSK